MMGCGLDSRRQDRSRKLRRLTCYLPLWHSEADPESSIDDFQVDPNLPDSIIADMVSAVTKGTPVQCDGYEGRKSVAIFEAVYESSRTGQVVKLD